MFSRKLAISDLNLPKPRNEYGTFLFSRQTELLILKNILKC